MLLLGINEGINSSVVVLENGKIRFALQEERINRKKNYLGFPHEALAFTLKYLNIQPGDVDSVCLSNIKSPNLTNEEFLASYDVTADQHDGQVLEGELTSEIQQKIETFFARVKHKAYTIKAKKAVEEQVKSHGFTFSQIVRAHHHLLHAASAYYGLRQDPDSPHIVLSLDGGGDDACAQVYIGENGQLRKISHTPPGHSVGNLYSRVTHLMGMTPHEHEYKLMGLAAYSERNKYTQPVIDTLRSYLWLNPENPLEFQCSVPELTYSIQPRMAKDFKRVRFDNLAGGMQFYTEDLLVEWVRNAIKITGIKKVVASGGVFMNVKANKLIAEIPELEYFDVFPSCGDETLAFGGVWHEYAAKSSTRGTDISFDSFLLGPDADYDIEEAKKEYSDKVNFRYEEYPDNFIAEQIAKGEIVARCSGKMEFGARALGNRSILADAEKSSIIPIINKMIKQRDFWMPFAPAMKIERCKEYIHVPITLPNQRISPFMMHTFDTTDKRNEFIAGVHAYDKTARAQIITQQYNPDFYSVISSFEKISGKAVVLNTSFNLHGHPIVCGAKDAIHVLLNSSLETLVVNNWVITKK